MNGFWSLKECSDSFPSMRFTHSLVAHRKNDIYLIQSSPSVTDKIREKATIARFQSDGKKLICKYDLKVLQFQKTSIGAFFCLVESDYKFEQLIIYTFGPTPFERR